MTVRSDIGDIGRDEMQPILIRLPEDLLRQVDQARWEAKVSRAQWVRDAIELRLPQFAAQPIIGAKPPTIEAPRRPATPPKPKSLIDALGASVEATRPLPCECGGQIYQIGKLKGKCSLCSRPRPL